MKLKSMLCVAALSLTATVAMGQQVSVNFNKSQSFSAYHTYAWGPDNANQIKNSILGQVAQQDIDAAMQGKGFQKVTMDKKPDIILTVSGGLRQQTSYQAWGMRGIGGGMGGITPEQNVEGTLIVDLFTASNQTLIWRGIAQNTLSNNGGKNQQLVNNAIQKMFKQWPKS